MQMSNLQLTLCGSDHVLLISWTAILLHNSVDTPAVIKVFLTLEMLIFILSLAESIVIA
jgi:hypothetical protein